MRFQGRMIIVLFVESKPAGITLDLMAEVLVAPGLTAGMLFHGAHILFRLGFVAGFDAKSHKQG